MERKRLILVGNGLDLSLGLKTGYQDFALWFFKEELLELINTGKRNVHSVSNGKMTLRDAGGNHNSFTHKFIDFTNELDGIGNLEFLQPESFRKRGLELMLRHPLYERLLFCDLWGDIERSYFSCMKDIVNKKSGTDQFQREQYNVRLMRTLNEEFSLVRSKLIEYLEAESDRIQELLETKRHFKSLFSKVLTGNSTINKSVDFVINFNYTKTVDLILSDQKTGNWVDRIDIHGRIGHDENLTPPIFGYGDDVDASYKELEDFNHSEYFRFFKSHYYSRDSNYERMLQFLDKSITPVSGIPEPLKKERAKFEVHIIGHSCGISDRTMLKTIFEHENCEAIYNYHWRSTKKEAMNDHFDRDINVSRHFDDKIKKRDRFKPFDFSLKY